MPPKIDLLSLPLIDLFAFRRAATVRHGLEDLQKVFDFELFRGKLDELCHYSEKGRPHYDVVQMFRILILQTLYNLSDEDMEFNLCDRIMREKGLEYSKGTAVDASFQEARRQRNTREENARIAETGGVPDDWNAHKKAQKDTDATWTYKGQEKHFGYKNHAAVDLKSKIIRDYKVTTAKVHDSNVCEEILPGSLT